MITLSPTQCLHCGKKSQETEFTKVIAYNQIVDVYCDSCNNNRMIAAYLEDRRMTLALYINATNLGVRHIPPLFNDIKVVQRAISDFSYEIWRERRYLYDYLVNSGTQSHKFQTHLHEVHVIKEGDLVFFHCYRLNVNQDPQVVLQIGKTSSNVTCQYKLMSGNANDIDALMHDIMGALKAAGTDTFLENPVLVPAT